MSAQRCLVVLATGLATFSCASWNPGKVREQNEGLVTDLRRQASVELRCPAGSIAVFALASDANGKITEAAVDGCGKRAAYTHLADHPTWQNGASGSSAP